MGDSTKLVLEVSYRGFLTWSPRRWAWEFLKRNPSFQAACDRLNTDDQDARKRIAYRFGLKQFKHYQEPYLRKVEGLSVGLPSFLSASVAAKSNLRFANKREKTVSVTLQPHQVLLVFDLRGTLLNARSLEAQIDAARRSLERRRTSLMTQAKLNKLPDQKLHSHLFLQYIQLLDLLSAGVSQTQALMAVHGVMDEVPSVVQSNFGHNVQAARLHAKEKYMYIAALNAAEFAGLERRTT